MRIVLLAFFVLAVSASPALGANLSRSAETVGRLHLPLLHFPLVLLIVAAALSVRRSMVATAGVVLTLGAIASVGAALTGLLLVDADPAPAHLAHRNAGLLTVACAIAATLAWRRLSFAGERALTLARVIAVVAGVAAAVTGHLGAEAAHGEGWLWRPLRGGAEERALEPPVVLEALPPPARERHPEAAVVEQPEYTAHIKPIFERSCLKCHGPEKRKGGLRLDQKRYALKGGESGPSAIVPGNAAGSIVYMSCSAEVDDDGVMPPRGKLLALSEIETIKRWLDQGAVWPDPTTTTTTTP